MWNKLWTIKCHIKFIKIRTFRGANFTDLITNYISTKSKILIYYFFQNPFFQISLFCKIY